MKLFSENPSFWRDRLTASALHLSMSVAVAVMAALLVFGLWYPYPYRELSGVRELFFLVVSVDVVLGPLVTLAVFNRTKPRRELRRDLAIVVVLQLAALSYGLWTVCVARPVHMVFEYDRLRVVHAIDIPQNILDKTPSGVVALPWTGPTLLALREFKDANEKMDDTLAALQGVSLSSRPELWMPYANDVPAILAAAKPVRVLKARYAAQAADIDRVITAAGRRPDAVVYLPIVGRKSFWTAFLDPLTADVIAVMPLDSF